LGEFALTRTFKGHEKDDRKSRPPLAANLRAAQKVSRELASGTRSSAAATHYYRFAKNEGTPDGNEERRG